jgi:hypothetical protein
MVPPFAWHLSPLLHKKGRVIGLTTLPASEGLGWKTG